MRYGPQKPPSAPMDVIIATRAEPAAPGAAVAKAQNPGVPEVSPRAATQRAAIDSHRLPPQSTLAPRPVPKISIGSAVCHLRSPLRSEERLTKAAAASAPRNGSEETAATVADE